MKFTKEEAFEKLKGELTKGGKTLRMSERTLNTQLETLMKVYDTIASDTELSDFVTMTLPSFSDVNSNMEKDYSDFVKTYKPDQSQNQSTTQQQQQQSNTTSNNDDVLSQLQAQLQQLQGKIEREEKEKALSQVRKNFKSELKTVGIKDDKWIDTYLTKINISEDLDIKEEAKSTLELYNLSKAIIPDGSTTPYYPSGGEASKKISWDDVKKEN
jgi:uncharacterized protein (UPF0335 family)